MPRWAKAAETALDELDRPCAATDIAHSFMPHVRTALGTLPYACCESVAQAAVALAESHNDRAIPAGYGRAFVRHFRKRSEQLESIATLRVEHRFALIELTLLATIASGWVGSSLPRLYCAANHKEYVRHVALAGQATQARRVELVQWQRVVSFLLNSPNCSLFVIRNLAYAFVWCGYFSPDKSRMTDKHIAQQLFATDREGFIRPRQEALRLLSNLLEYSLQPLTGEAP